MVNIVNVKRLMHKHKPCNLHIGQFLESVTSTYKRLRYLEHTIDKDFTDKPCYKVYYK